MQCASTYMLFWLSYFLAHLTQWLECTFLINICPMYVIVCVIIFVVGNNENFIYFSNRTTEPILKKHDMDNWAKCSQFSRKWGIKYSCNYLYMSVKINHCHVFFYYQGRLMFMFTDWNFWKYHFFNKNCTFFRIFDIYTYYSTCFLSQSSIFSWFEKNVQGVLGNFHSENNCTAYYDMFHKKPISSSVVHYAKWRMQGRRK